ncbi:MAG: hypothetical protein WCK78_12690, partial [Paludibacter sp.]
KNPITLIGLFYKYIWYNSTSKFRSEENQHHIWLKPKDEFVIQNEIIKIQGYRSVNDADIWNEGF